MDHALNALRRYADFSGRSRRSEYWYYVLFVSLGIVALMVIETLLWETPILTGIAYLGIIIPSLAVAVRRLHDTGRSGWWYFISLVPIVGPIALLVFFCEDSKPGPNKWGPNPKEDADDLMQHLVS